MSGEVLSWIAYAAGALGVVIYFFAWLRRPAWVRLLNNAGLFFTALGLIFVPFLVPQGPADRYAVFAVLFLLLGVAAQMLAAFRERRAWDGLDRRERERWSGDERRGGEVT